jgi:hypothetical protein
VPITIKETIMELPVRIDLLTRLGDYMMTSDEQWILAKERAERENTWFIPEFVELATAAIAREFLKEDNLKKWTQLYNIPSSQAQPKTIGLVMAGNIPLVGFHDFLAIFLSGHRQMIKLSSKDQILLKHLVQKLVEWDPRVSEYISFNEMLKGCDAYIATGSNNSARYFEYYFGKYPHIIRRNRTSVAVINGKESDEQLDKLADDVYQYFGLGCRNVTKVYVPKGYDFTALLNVFKKYNHLIQFHKYKNNYDYQLALLILNKQLYMTNGSVLLVENPSAFSPISVLNYEFYEGAPDLNGDDVKENIQCVVGIESVPFGQAQQPGLCDYADGRDTLQFLLSL